MKQSGLTLYCLPYAGGRAAAYLSWIPDLSGTARVRPLELPGHGERRAEALLADKDTLVKDIADRIRGEQPGRYALFGHSLGALLAFEAAHALAGPAGPRALLVSGRNGPALPHPVAPVHRLPADELLRHLYTLGGVPRELLNTPEVTDLFLPAIRADLKIAEDYERPGVGPLDCPVWAAAGDDDPLADPVGLRAWAGETNAGFTMTTVPGGHMPLHQPAFVAEIRAFLWRLTSLRPRHRVAEGNGAGGDLTP
ncbi:alpha/beta fold hydrolase [Streptomyces sp. B5E4]|uniref:thioesterase II family protein n=1 Tax=Streptomyces sp. B5E4 TaxID=3153568 RepID=UPI00325E30AD